MEFLIILAAIVSASVCHPVISTWTLNDLSPAVETKANDTMHPYLVDALNQIMYALFTGNNEEVLAIIPSPTGAKNWTLAQLQSAAGSSDGRFQPYIIRALHQLTNLNADGDQVDSMAVAVPALDISIWTIADVEDAKKDPSIKPIMLQHLKKADDDIQSALKRGEKKENVRAILVTPVGLIPNKSDTVPDIIPA